MLIWIRNTGFFLANCGFADSDSKEICGVAIILRNNHDKFTDLRFSDWNTPEICGFATAE
jgi:hypothetical protein